MGVPAQRGHIAFAVQSGEIGDGAFNPASLTWRRHRAVMADLGVQEMTDTLPYEVGGGLFTTAAYKNGVFIGGSASLEARLQNTLGYLLYGACGAHTSIAPVAGTTPRRNIFRPAADEAFLPLMAIRRYLPAVNNSGTDGITEYGVDCIVSGLTITVPQMGTLKTEFTFLGRRPIAIDGESATGNAYEDGTSTALSCLGSVSLPDFASYLPGASATGGRFAGAQITITNQTTTPQQEMIIGSHYPDRFMPIARGAMVSLSFKWPNADLYRHLRYDPPVSGQRSWTAKIGMSPVTITSASPNSVPTYSGPTSTYQFSFSAEKVEWTMTVTPLAGQQMVQAELLGIVVENTSGPVYEIELRNDASYSF